MPDGWPAPLPEWAKPVPKGQAYADTITPLVPQGPWNRARRVAVRGDAP